MKLYTDIDKITSDPIQYLVAWEAPERICKVKDRSWYVIYSFFFVVLIAFLAILGEVFLIVLVLAFAFLWFIQGSIAPQDMEHIITTIGIKTFNKLYKWKDIQDFWFSKKDEHILLNLDLYLEDNHDSDFKKRISLIVNEEDQEKIFNILIRTLDYGDHDTASYNIITRITNGEFIDVTHFLPKEENNLENLIPDVPLQIGVEEEPTNNTNVEAKEPDSITKRGRPKKHTKPKLPKDLQPS